jgi:hypothetical protein
MKVGSALDPEFSSTGTERERERESMLAFLSASLAEKLR